METFIANRTLRKRGLTLSQYIRRRNGVPAGARGSLQNMLYRSLGASTFAGFWRHWNPVFGYALGRYVFAPLKRAVPSPIALVATFVVCGATHDLVTMAVRGAPAFFFTPWFFFLGVGVLLGQAADLDLSDKPWPVRAASNLTYTLACLAITLVIGHFTA
jgi:D-alanyl-lipoteichoic acid acyltransferase DltB (MBOAT superfamily)